jgi:predicted RNA-binding Zn-ribbon protein involved in translation (DUF1610 family)
MVQVGMNASDEIDSKIRDLKDSWEKGQKPRTCSKCGENLAYVQDSTGNVTWTCPQCGKVTHEGSLEEFDQMSLGRKIGKYFLHGIAYALIALLLFFGWIIVGVALVLLGSFIGLILAFMLLVFIVGAINTFVSSLVWGFSMKTSLGSIFLHGLVLCLIFVVVSLLTIFPLYMLGHNLIYVVLLEIGLCFVNGFIGEKVAQHWTEQ